MLASGVKVHESAYVDEPCVIGAGTSIWHFSHVMKNCRIGRQCNIGQNVVVSPDVTIGDHCKIQNNVSLYTGVVLEDYVFCGPSMVFTNVINPRCEIPRRDQYKPTLVRRGASLGANCTIVCGVTIGKYAFVGAGAVVASDVPDYALMLGVPARRKGWACRCGSTLPKAGAGGAMACPACKNEYRESGETLSPVREVQDAIVG
ncbi:MAG: N-acetyltransferase [Phycisphaeraceae bacterium]|nr:N-acetyltransferase [Phycisphaeraceae bacterium]MCW5763103.1 N-acetyltransferase [Phycisphaeraceae bacterium]